MQLLWIRNRIRKLDYNYAELVTGSTGTSKTSMAIFKAMLISPKTFDETFYCTSPKEFLQKVEDSRTGDTIIWDEAGVGLSARQWYSLSNILAGQTLQTYREKNLCVFFCTPDASFVDIQARKLVNGFSEMKRYSNHEAYQYLYNVEVDRKQGGKIYYPYFNFIIGDKRVTLKLICLPRKAYSSPAINQEIFKRIRDKASEFKAKVLAKNKQDAEQFERERFGIAKTVFDIANEVTDKIDDYKNSIGRIDWKLIGAEYDLSRDKAQTIVALIRRNKDE